MLNNLMLWHIVLQKIPDPKTFHRRQPGQPIPDMNAARKIRIFVHGL